MDIQSLQALDLTYLLQNVIQLRHCSIWDLFVSFILYKHFFKLIQSPQQDNLEEIDVIIGLLKYKKLSNNFCKAFTKLLPN